MKTYFFKGEMVKLERRLSLKKPVIIAGLVLTLMLAAFVGVATTGAHAAPVAKQTGIHSAAARAALIAAKKKEKSSSCSTSSKFYVDPCSVRMTATGQIVVTLIGHKLSPSNTYTVDAQELDALCGSIINGTTETTDQWGNFNDTFVAPTCKGGGTYYIQLQNNASPFNVLTTKLTVK